MRGWQIIGGTGVVLAAAGLVAALAAPAATDYTAMPSGDSELASKVTDCKVTLAAAIEAAEKAAGSGKASHAAMHVVDGKLEISIVIVASGVKTEVMIDPETGEVVSTKNALYPGDSVEGELVTTDSGLQYYEITVGDGAQPAGPTSEVTVHYTGWLTTGKKFDSSVDRGRTSKFPLNRVIAGWTEGVGSMKVGGKRKLIIPFNLAYGEKGRPGSIPPKATLIFDIELISIKD